MDPGWCCANGRCASRPRFSKNDHVTVCTCSTAPRSGRSIRKMCFLVSLSLVLMPFPRNVNVCCRPLPATRMVSPSLFNAVTVELPPSQVHQIQQSIGRYAPGGPSVELHGQKELIAVHLIRHGAPQHGANQMRGEKRRMVVRCTEANGEIPLEGFMQDIDSDRIHSYSTERHSRRQPLHIDDPIGGREHDEGGPPQDEDKRRRPQVLVDGYGAAVHAGPAQADPAEDKDEPPRQESAQARPVPRMGGDDAACLHPGVAQDHRCQDS
mmetsp:Transcript_96864/g.167050  ORF Transcript_96864/g.167050 Transcript_96864/m.167050 type:complete len:267 (+) Transcript_96864:476-1276(+)